MNRVLKHGIHHIVGITLLFFASTMFTAHAQDDAPWTIDLATSPRATIEFEKFDQAMAQYYRGLRSHQGYDDLVMEDRGDFYRREWFFGTNRIRNIEDYSFDPNRIACFSPNDIFVRCVALRNWRRVNSIGRMDIDNVEWRAFQIDVVLRRLDDGRLVFYRFSPE